MRLLSYAVTALVLSACAASPIAHATEATPSASTGVPAAAPTATAAPTSTPEVPTLPPDLPTQCHASPFGPPDKQCNPGLADARVTQDTIAATICAAGYASRVSPPGAYLALLRAQQLNAYGFGGDPQEYDEDHILPVELGGDPRDPQNLWPQTDTGLVTEMRDELRKWAHDQVCTGRMTLASAQQQMLGDWRAFYQAMLGARPRDKATPSPTSELTITITRSTYGAVTVATHPGAECTARVLLPGKDSGSILPSQIVDASGIVTWTYPAPFTTTTGTGKHTISCAYGGDVSTNGASFGVPGDAAPSA